MEPAFKSQGWEIYYGLTYSRQIGNMVKVVRKLRERFLDNNKAYASHPAVKQLAAINDAMKRLVPSDPYGEPFVLRGELKEYCRVKGRGIGERSRLFYRAFELDNRKAIIYLWLGYPRKHGDKNDCYTVFKKAVKDSLTKGSLDCMLRVESERKFKD